MPDVATQTLGSLPILQHAHASVATQTKLLRVPQGECSPWRRMVLGLLTEMDCEGAMRAVHDGWTVEQGKQRSREVNACFTYNVHLITGDWNTKAALWRLSGRLTRDIILLRAWASAGTNDWLTLIGKLDEFVDTLDTDTAHRFVSQLCNAYDQLFPAMVANRRSAMEITRKRRKKGTRGRGSVASQLASKAA